MHRQDRRAPESHACVLTRRAKPFLAVALSSLFPSLLGPVAHANDDDFFEKKIRPVLAENCLECHSSSLGQMKGGLDLESREGWQSGGESGPVIVPGDTEKSLLLKAVAYAHPELHMPPKGKLPEPVVRDLEQWIAMGALDPRERRPAAEATPPSTKKFDIDGGRRHFAFQPITDAAPPAVTNEAWARDPLDRFVLGKLEERGLAKADAADRVTWLRRVTLGLTGLPPTLEDQSAFLADSAPDAFERVVDRLLASPQYGERFGRFWLDLVRYSDSNGLDENLALGVAWRYRDYVVGAFNADKPYDQFVREQLAGDLLPEPDPEKLGTEVAAKQLRDQQTATGFLVLGPKMLAEQDKEKLVLDTIDEQIDVVGKTFLGLTIACARCHDHKFDPIAQKDYYALAGIFRSTSTFEELSFVSRWRERELATHAEIAARDAWRSERDGKIQERDRLVNESKAARKTAIEQTLPRYVEAARDAAKGALYVEAESFQNGSLRIDHDQYGSAENALVHTHRGGEQFVEYRLTLPAPGRYALEIAYAQQEARPVRVLVDGKVVAEKALEAATGGWHLEHVRFATACEFDVVDPTLTLRIERAKDQPPHFPHLDALLLHPAGLDAWPSAVPQDLAADALRAIAITLARPSERARFTSNKLTDEDRKALLDRIPEAVLSDENHFAPETRTQLATLREAIAVLDTKKPRDFDRALSVADDKVVELPLHIRGSHLNKADTVQPRSAPEVFAPACALPPIAEGRSGRLEFADWLVSKSHPLTARVIANRVWQFHFGHGLVRSASNWGLRGEAPSHPELLDRLARDLMDSGWSLKALHRRIVLSATYRQSARGNGDISEADPENRLLSRFPRQRLDAEQLRDSVLAVCGTLDRTVGGSLLATNDRDYVTNDQSNDNAGYDKPRRTVYLPIIRNSMFDFLSTFDYADPSTPIERRPQSVLASQALWLINSPFMREQTLALTRRIALDAGTAATAQDLVARAYRHVLLREATAAESERTTRWLSDATAEVGAEDALAALLQVLFSSSEFLYVE